MTHSKSYQNFEKNKFSLNLGSQRTIGRDHEGLKRLSGKEKIIFPEIFLSLKRRA